MFEKITLKSKENSEPLAEVIQMYIYEKTNSENTIEFDTDEKGYYITVNIEFFDYAAYAFASYVTENIYLFFTLDLIDDFGEELSNIEKELLFEIVSEQLNSSEGEELKREIANRLTSFTRENEVISIEGFTKFAINDCIEKLCDLFCDVAFSFIMSDRFYYTELISALRNLFARDNNL